VSLQLREDEAIDGCADPLGVLNGWRFRVLQGAKRPEVAVQGRRSSGRGGRPLDQRCIVRGAQVDPPRDLIGRRGRELWPLLGHVRLFGVSDQSIEPALLAASIDRAALLQWTTIGQIEFTLSRLAAVAHQTVLYQGRSHVFLE
jgi:hypothetical protein